MSQKEFLHKYQFELLRVPEGTPEEILEKLLEESQKEYLKETQKEPMEKMLAYEILKKNTEELM